jgi:hypothetical protein
MANPKLSEVVDFLREQTGVNIVVGTDVKDTALPSLHLQNVSAKCVLKVICQPDTDLGLREQGEEPNVVYHITPKPEDTLEPAQATGNEKTASIDFPGGTLADLQKVLNSQLEANIVLPSSVTNYKVPKLRLRKATAAGALHAALIGTGSELEVARIWDGRGKTTVSVLRVFLPQPKRGAKNEQQRVVHVYTLHVPPLLAKRAEELEAALRDRQERTPALDQLRDSVQIASRQFMDEMSASVHKAVAIQRGIRGQGDSDLPQVEVHWETKIVIVSGREGDMNIVAEVMTAMGGTPAGEPRNK